MNEYLKTKFLETVLNMEITPEEISLMGYYSARRYKLKDPWGIFSSTFVPYKFKVIIEDFSDFFVTPVAPDVTFDSDKINELLLQDFNFLE